MSPRRMILIFPMVVQTITTLYAQDADHHNKAINQILENITASPQLNLNYEALYDNLVQQLSNPLDLNHATEDELRSLYILGENQVRSLMNHRSRHGQFLSVNELQSIDGFDSLTIANLMPFVKIVDVKGGIDHHLWGRVRQEKGYLINRMERTLEQQKGYMHNNSMASHYAGSPNKWQLRYRLSRPGDFSIGFAGEKDPGEAIRWHPVSRQYGLDAYTGHLQLMNKRRFRNLLIGDFVAQFGQGLVLGGGFGMGKGAETISAVRRSNLGFMPHTSVGESGFFRGTGLSYVLSSHWELHLLASSLRRDGNVLRDSAQDENTLISSFATSGYHRTPAELAARKQVRETNMAAVLEWKSSTLTSGLIIHHTVFDAPIVRKPTPYNQFAFHGKENSNAGFYLNYGWNNLSFFGEAAFTLHHGGAVSMGVLASITPYLDLSLHYRNFARNYVSLYSNAISENTVPQNEEGFYWGIRIHPATGFTLAAYLDMFRFPWLHYRDYSPGQGNEWLARLTHPFSKTASCYIQIRQESKNRNANENIFVYQPLQGIKRSCWLNFDYEARKGLSFKTRLQWSNFHHGKTMTSGFAMIQDASTSIGPITVTARVALFETDDYENRIYSFERDALMSLSFPAYFGTGTRYFFLAHWNACKRLDIWIRWAQTRFSDRNVIGSGSETIFGNHKNDLKLQFRIKF